MAPIDPREAQDADEDSTSDPAKNADEGHDWSTEGGATTEGPATSASEDVSEPESARSEDD